MAAFDPITALEYNNIRQSIATRVGDFGTWTEHSIPTSTTTSGYGRNFVSNIVTGGGTVGVSDRVTQQQMFDLYLDLQAGYVHQFGSQNSTILPAGFAQGTTVEFQDITDFNTIANAVNAFNHLSTDFDSSSFTTNLLRTGGGVSCSSSRSTPWGTGGSSVITHRVTVDFGTHNSFLYFLSAGGEIRFDASLTGGTSATANTKDWDWAQILSAMGTIRFGRVGSNWRTEAISPGTGTGSLLSSISTGTTPTTIIFTKQGGVSTAAPPTGTAVYDNNQYRIRASTNNAFASATQLIFQIEFDDADTGSGGQAEPGGEFGTPIDESVGGTTTSNVYTYTPSSDFVINAITYPAVQLPAPIGTINAAL
jgi:hypothetical protein